MECFILVIKQDGIFFCLTPFAPSFLDCETVGFFPKISRKKVKCGVRDSHALRACEAREKKTSPQSRSLFSASFQTFCLTTRVLEYAKIRTVLQSTFKLCITATIDGNQHTFSSVKPPSCLEWTLVTINSG